LSPATAIHAGGIHTIENPRHVRHNPKFLCKICEICHLTCLCPATVVVPEAWSFPRGPSDYEFSLASQPSLVDTFVILMQYLADTHIPLWVDASLDLLVSHLVQRAVVYMQSSTDTTPIFGGDESLDLVVSHPIQLMVEEVVTPMQFLVDSTLLVLVLYLIYHVLSISSPAPFEQERFLLSLQFLEKFPLTGMVLSD
jgi:hypothetical protein